MEQEHPKQPESVNDTYLVEQGDTNTTPDSSDMSNNGREADHDDDITKERGFLASLIEQMKLEIDGSKKTNKSLESLNKSLREASMFLNNELKRYKESDFVKNVELKCAKAYGLLEEQKVTSAKEYYYADHMNAILGFYTDLDQYSDMSCDYLEALKKCKNLEIELSKSKTPQTGKRFANLEKRCIDLELALQHEKEKNVCENYWVKHSLISGDTEKALKDKIDSLIAELNRKTVESHDLRASLQDKIIANFEIRNSWNKMKGKSVDTNFKKPSILGKPPL
ncbi:hypothetical protein Tco_1095382 [Tanacetum coccineum]